jgi:NADH:ubiquinone reductase (H+-translocating)
VIVGAGPTGVELAGAFAEIKQHVLPNDYRGIDFSTFQIMLIEGSANTLNNMSEEAKKASRNYLEGMGVKLLTETYVRDYDGKILTLENGDVINSRTVIWAAGVIGNRIQGLSEEVMVRGNRIKVDGFNRVVGSDSIFAIGDIAYMETPDYPQGHPQVANVAINQAKRLVKNLKFIEQKKAIVEFKYRDLGSMATIGRNKAVVDLPFIKFKGYPAWLVWMFLHLMLILSVKNKLIIFINWAWAYLTKDSSLRLILRERK